MFSLQWEKQKPSMRPKETALFIAKIVAKVTSTMAQRAVLQPVGYMMMLRTMNTTYKRTSPNRFHIFFFNHFIHEFTEIKYRFTQEYSQVFFIIQDHPQSRIITHGIFSLLLLSK